MRRVHIIMPMAGRGQRFINGGYTTPKPFLTIDGEHFFQRALKSLTDAFDEKGVAYTTTCIMQTDHLQWIAIASSNPFNNIITIDHVTRGAVETVCKASGLIDANDVVVILDCDFEFKSDVLVNKIISIAKGGTLLGGLLVSFDSDSDRYSYARVDEKNYVIETAEKQVISNHALAGCYVIESGALFQEAANKLLKDNAINNEYYCSLLMGHVISKSNVYLCPLTYYRSFGTPEELKQSTNDKTTDN